MSLEWIRENPPRWDAPKAAIVGGAPEGVFAPSERAAGDLLPGEWWRVEDDGRVVGYGWMDCIWGDAEILLSVDPAAQGRGIGTFILDRLEEEASARGLNYLFNVVRPTHPEGERVGRWLKARRFEPSRDERLMRRVRPPAGR